MSDRYDENEVNRLDPPVNMRSEDPDPKVNVILMTAYVVVAFAGGLLQVLATRIRNLGHHRDETTRISLTVLVAFAFILPAAFVGYRILRSTDANPAAVAAAIDQRPAQVDPRHVVTEDRSPKLTPSPIAVDDREGAVTIIRGLIDEGETTDELTARIQRTKAKRETATDAQRNILDTMLEIFLLERDNANYVFDPEEAEGDPKENAAEMMKHRATLKAQVKRRDDLKKIEAAKAKAEESEEK